MPSLRAADTRRPNVSVERHTAAESPVLIRRRNDKRRGAREQVVVGRQIQGFSRWTISSTKPPLELPQGRGLNVTLGHQSAQPPARVSRGTHAAEQGVGQGTAEGRDTLALAPLSITIGMSC
ncbi:unnamed protein product [Pleuronectes platessa]|uniref:Uncharacterized protein n=1 Tax=Pleuronectes platessa TaxID=8262 RepID=A0A9N7TVN4_PLEPL|nr:unnamed protein product [Pleuronectes platessa]